MNKPVERITPSAGAVVKQTVDSTELSVSADVGVEALAAQAEAEVKARWAIAQRNPRDWDKVRMKLLKECERPGFARSARYAKPVAGTKVEGPSIRFVETALRCMTNVYCPTTVISDSETERRVQVMVTDLENNISWPRQITIQKTVERSDARGREVISDRINLQGKKVYLVVATEDELLNKENALISKAIRQSGLRVIPGDLVDEAQRQCIQTQLDRDAKDPDGARKALLDAFTDIGVTVDQLKSYVGHPLEQLQPAELADLRGIYEAIRDGESKWSDVLELRKVTPVEVVAPDLKQAVSAPIVSTILMQGADGKPVEVSATARVVSTPDVGKPAPQPTPPSAAGLSSALPTSLPHSSPPAAAPLPTPPGPKYEQPEEAAIDQALQSAAKRSDLSATVKLINALKNDERKAYWRGRYTARQAELPS